MRSFSASFKGLKSSRFIKLSAIESEVLPACQAAREETAHLPHRALHLRHPKEAGYKPKQLEIKPKRHENVHEKPPKTHEDSSSSPRLLFQLHRGLCDQALPLPRGVLERRIHGHLTTGDHALLAAALSSKAGTGTICRRIALSCLKELSCAGC